MMSRTLQVPREVYEEVAGKIVAALFSNPTAANVREYLDVAERLDDDLKDAVARKTADKICDLTRPASVLDLNAAVIEPCHVLGGQPRVLVSSKHLGWTSIEAEPSLASRLKRGDQVALMQTPRGPKLVNPAGVYPPSQVCRYECRLPNGSLVVTQEGGIQHVLFPSDELMNDGADLRPGVELECAPEVGLAIRLLKDRQRPPVGHRLPVTDVGLEALGGQPEAKRKLKHLVRLFCAPEDTRRSLGLNLHKYVLLSGPPGVGKTYSMGPFAGEFKRQGMNPAVNYLKGPEVRSKWVGETERQIRAFKAECIELAKTHRPVIAVLDEFDALILSRERFSFSSEVGLMTVDTILSEFGGIEDSTMDGIMVIGISNKADTGLIDQAALREGRFSYIINFTVMTRECDVQEVAFIHLGQRRLASGLTPEMASERLASYAFNGNDGVGIPLATVRFSDGRREVITSRHVLTGAIVAGAVTRAAERALNRALAGSDPSISLGDLYRGVECALRDLSVRFSRSSITEYFKWPQDKLARVVEVTPAFA